MPPRRWTHKRLLKAAWRRLNDKTVRLSPRFLRHCMAELEAPTAKAMNSGKGPRNLKFDYFQGGIIPLTFHELLHDALQPSLKGAFGRNVIETFVLALEADLAEMVLADPDEVDRWRYAILKRLGTSVDKLQ